MSFITKIIGKIAPLISGSLSQEELRSDVVHGDPYENTPTLTRFIAGSGMVLLKNEGMLPLGDESFALFGRTAIDTFFVGYGSGGDVRAPYRVSILKGIIDNGSLNFDKELANVYEKWTQANPTDNGFWGHWPWRYPEMPLSDEIVKSARAKSNKAVVVIGRAAGEDRENKLEKGSFFLHDEEIDMLDKITAQFDDVIVLMNIGNVIDFSWVENYGDKIKALLITWQGGMETGNAVADVLSGKISPDGKLPMTIARNYDDYPSAKDFGDKDANFYTEDVYVGYRYFETFNPSAVLYPFGFGLGYGSFRRNKVEVEYYGSSIKLEIEVENVGKVSARDTIQVYVSAPQGKLGKPAKVLVGFDKTSLLASGEKEVVQLVIPQYAFASYDDIGAVKKSSYVLEKGDYALYVGSSVRDNEKVYTFTHEEDLVVEELSEAGSPQISFERIKPTLKGDKLVIGKEQVPTRSYSLKQRILDNLPDDSVPYTGDKGYKLIDVKENKITLDEFVAQLSNVELEAITRGDYVMHSKLGAPGNAGAMAGVLKSLRDKGVPGVITSDGPSGMRLNAVCTLLPIGTLLSSTWDTKLIESLYEVIGREMLERGSDILLGPGMNIHRNPLCGRNFEYYSEDPVLTGKMACAFVNGIQANGASACPKHFACNNQETNRNRNDSRLSERALREIYLKGFEICIKESSPKTLMTSYNKINGVWGHYNYDLCTTILRGEWGYKGLVMTDWWMQKSVSQEFPNICDQAYRVRAQVDVLMPGGGRLPFAPKRPDGTLLRTLGKKEGITRGELIRTAKTVLTLALGSSALDRLNKK
ncbi:MAG: glycoside hydrolase family 3 C-terminal domain-containing protein [Clostridia bacterium]|nr:glycoside hydrolase family 3 C-terminal domain-containing protein [Clostridia bacterium]